MKFQIENYENMTLEEKVAALESFEPEKNGWVQKGVFDKKASEAADLSKQLKSRMTEDEARAAQAAAEHAALIERAEKAENALAVSTYVAAYAAMGYDEKLAQSTAEAMVKGDTDTVLKNQKLHLDNREKALRAELLKQTPHPAGGTGPNNDYDKKISEAQAAGDYAAVAYYTRLAAQEAAATE